LSIFSAPRKEKGERKGIFKSVKGLEASTLFKPWAKGQKHATQMKITPMLNPGHGKKFQATQANSLSIRWKKSKKSYGFNLTALGIQRKGGRNKQDAWKKQGWEIEQTTI